MSDAKIENRADVVVRRVDGNVTVCVGRVWRVSTQRFAVMCNGGGTWSGDYSAKTGFKIGNHNFRADVVGPDEAEAARAELRAHEVEKVRAEDERRAAEYAALPEGVKLARTVTGYLDSVGEKRVAEEIPVEVLRAVVEAITRARGK